MDWLYFGFTSSARYHQKQPSASYPYMRYIILITTCFALIACGPVKEIDETADWTVEKFYRTARANVAEENYLTAIDQYETLESRFPFGKYATQAQLDVAYAYYKFREPESAIAAVERFIKLNPRHETVDYAYYLRGLINFDSGGSVLDIVHERDLSNYDRTALLSSYEDFKLLIRRFPDSNYVDDSRQRMVYLREQLATADLKVAQYYASRNAWVAAANRTNSILKEYQGTNVIRSALEIQLEAYQQLGLSDLAADTLRIITLNYGDS